MSFIKENSLKLVIYSLIVLVIGEVYNYFYEPEKYFYEIIYWLPFSVSVALWGLVIDDENLEFNNSIYLLFISGGVMVICMYLWMN